jgi:TPR repeat protein
VFAGHDVTSREEARRVFLGCEIDPRAVCFAVYLGWSADIEIRRAADLGDAFAQSMVAERSFKDAQPSRFEWAEKSAAQGERDGFEWLGYCYRDGYGCKKDKEVAKRNFFVAAQLGCVAAWEFVGLFLDSSDLQRFVWFGKAAESGRRRSFLTALKEEMHAFNTGTGNAKFVFALGRALRGNIDNEKLLLFGGSYESHIEIATQALQLYEFQLSSYRNAVDAWTIVGLRNRVVKDIRKMIGKMIWDCREEVAYKNNVLLE